MACLHMKKKLSEYLDGALDAEEKAFVEEHVASCEDCAAELSELRKTVGHMRSLEEVEPPAWFMEKVMQRVRREAEKKGLLRRLFYPLHIKIPAEALALVLVAVVAVHVYDAMQPGITVTEPVIAENQTAPAKFKAPGADTFSHPEDEASHPFAPSSEARGKEEEEVPWEHDEVSGKNEADVFSLKQKAQLSDRAEPEFEGLMEPGAASDEPRTKTKALYRKADVQTEKAPSAPAEESLAVRGEFEKASSEAGAVLPEPGLKLVVEVGDAGFALDEIETAVKRLGGRLMEKDKQPDGVVLAEIESGKVDKLVSAVAEVGTITSKALTSNGNTVFVRIELTEESGP